MDAYSGIYYLQGGDEQPATFVFLKDKLSIGLVNPQREARVVYWYYDRIIKENFQKAGQAVVRYEGHPQQVIEVRSKEFAEKLSDIIHRGKSPFYSGIYNKRNAALWKIAFALIAILAATYFWLVPFLAGRLALRVPVSYEKQLGDQVLAVMKAGYRIDQPRTAYLNEFFRALRITTPYDIRITVVKEEVANAFALPGGNIVVYDKIISSMKSYEELAALLSHEFTHINNRHTTKTLFRKLGSTIFLSLVVGDLGAIGSIVIGNADKLKNLSYSRSLEKEADLEGLQLLAERKIDGNGFVGLFEILKRQPSVKTAEWSNSHPNLDKRIDYTRKSEYFNRLGTAKDPTLHAIFLRIQTAE